MTMVEIKLLLLFLNRLELIILQSKENVVEKKGEKKNLFQIPQFQLLELLTLAFFSLVMSSCNSIIDYEDINIFGDRKTTSPFHRVFLIFYEHTNIKPKQKLCMQVEGMKSFQTRGAAVQRKKVMVAEQCKFYNRYKSKILETKLLRLLLQTKIVALFSFFYPSYPRAYNSESPIYDINIFGDRKTTFYDVSNKLEEMHDRKLLSKQQKQLSSPGDI